MAVEIFLLAAVHNMRVREPLGRGMVIGENLFLSNDPGIPKRIMNQSTVDTIGSMEAAFLCNAPLIIHGKWTEEGSLAAIDPLPYLNIKMRLIYAFYSCLWTLRDNCANSETVFLIEREAAGGERVSVNGMAFSYGRADSQMLDEEFSRSEIQQARDKFSARFQALEADRMTPEIEFKFAKESGRVGRAFKFLFAARVSGSTILKVAYLCSCLEALFCSDSGEIAHKLAERAAVFLETGRDERILIYRFIKKAYGIRSHIIHGSAVKGEVEGLVNTSIELDRLVRKIINRILSESKDWDLFMKSEMDVFEQCFAERLFS